MAALDHRQGLWHIKSDIVLDQTTKKKEFKVTVRRNERKIRRDQDKKKKGIIQTSVLRPLVR
jgi:hypothetical protein